MNEQSYYYLNGKAQLGPFTLDKLQQTPLKPDTLVWNKSLPDWVEARMLPELQAFFVARPQAAPPPPYPSEAQSSYNQPLYSPTFGNQNIRPPMPDNYMVWAVLATVLCCLPLGIAAIVQSSKVSSAYYAGDYEGAVRASNDARKWAIWSAVSSVIVVVLYLIVLVALALAGSLA